MPCACGPCACNPGAIACRDTPPPHRRSLFEPGVRGPSVVGNGPAAALYDLADRHERAILFAVIHCTAGDALITAAALIVAILTARRLRWPIFGGRMALAAVLLGLGYTVFSEWLNAHIRHSWSYTEAMPVIPPLGTGLSPLLQWLIVPGIALL